MVKEIVDNINLSFVIIINILDRLEVCEFVNCICSIEDKCKVGVYLMEKG